MPMSKQALKTIILFGLFSLPFVSFLVYGATFFHFSPKAFAKLLKASGFSRVEIISSFDLKNFRTGLDVPHVVYHCWK